MSGLNLSQRLWQLADGTVQRALDGFAAQYDDTVKKLNNAFDFSDKSLSVRLPMTAPSVTSAVGFKAVVGPWQRSQATFATAATPLVWASDSNATGASALTQGFYATHPGSILGVALAGQAGATTTLTATVYKGGVATAATAQLVVSTAGTTSTTATFAKGAVPFAQGDRLDVYYAASAANTGQLVASFTVEMAA